MKDLKMKYNWAELLNQGVIVILFGGAIGIFSGFFMSMQQESNETHRMVQEIKIKQEVDRQTIIETIAELHTKMDEIKNQHIPFPEIQNPEIVLPPDDSTWDKLDNNRSKMQERFSVQQSLDR